MVRRVKQILAHKRTGGVGQVVFVAQRRHPLRRSARSGYSAGRGTGGVRSGNTGCRSITPSPGRRLKFAVPSICRRYHSGFVSSSRASGVNFSAPSGKCPQKITTYAQTLRSRLAATFAAQRSAPAATGSARERARSPCRPGGRSCANSASCGRTFSASVAARSCSECRSCSAIPHSKMTGQQQVPQRLQQIAGLPPWSRVTRMTPKPRSSSTPTTLVKTWWR